MIGARRPRRVTVKLVLSRQPCCDPPVLSLRVFNLSSTTGHLLDGWESRDQDELIHIKGPIS